PAGPHQTVFQHCATSPRHVYRKTGIPCWLRPDAPIVRWHLTDAARLPWEAQRRLHFPESIQSAAGQMAPNRRSTSPMGSSTPSAFSRIHSERSRALNFCLVMCFLRPVVFSYLCSVLHVPNIIYANNCLLKLRT